MGKIEMNKKFRSKIVAAIVCLCCFSPTLASQTVRLERTEEHSFKAKNVDQEYKIQVCLPPGYQKAVRNFPVLYLLDADKSLGMAKDVAEWLAWAGEIPEIVIIGIAYGEGTKAWWDKRSRDYAPWKDSQKVWGVWPLAGGAANFLKFLRDELIPWVDSKYRTDRNDRALAGLSLGGSRKDIAN